MTDESRSFPELFSSAIAQVGRLVRDEIQLARAEISTNISRAAIGLAMMAAGGVLTIAALVLVLLALAAWLETLGFSTPVADLMAGVVGMVISGALAWAGLARLKPENITPKRTMEQLQRDAAAVKEQVK